MYKVGKRQKSKIRRAAFWCFVVAALVLVAWGAYLKLRGSLQPKTTITSTHTVTTKVTYKTQNKHYDEGDFSIDLPSEWQPVPRPAGPYKSFTWQTAKRDTDGQIITVYEDTIPVNFVANRVLIIHGESDHLGTDGSVSDNCSTFTGGTSKSSTPAKWEGVAFLCDQANQQRDVVGTSSTDGVNVVLLKSPGNGAMHKYFFTYTDYSINSDYTVFYNALNSFRMN